MQCQQPRRYLANMANSQTEQKTLDGNLPPRINRIKKVAGGLLASILALGERCVTIAVALLKGENVVRVADYVLFKKHLQTLAAQTLNIEGVT